MKYHNVVSIINRINTRKMPLYWQYHGGLLIPYSYAELVQDLRDEHEIGIRPATDGEFQEMIEYMEAHGTNR